MGRGGSDVVQAERLERTASSLPRIAIVLSHPIQHFCPAFVHLAASRDWTIRVFFASRSGSETYFDPQFGRQVSWTGLACDRFPHEFVNGDAVLPIDAWLDAPELPARLVDFDPVAVLVFGYAQAVQRRALAWGRRHGRKVFMFSDAELRHERSPMLRAAKKAFLRRYLARVDGFLTVGDANEAYYRLYGVPDTKLFRAAYPIDVDLHEQAFARRSHLRRLTRAKLGIADSTIACSVVGKFVPWKRQQDVLAAAAMLLANGWKVTVLLVGSGERAEVLTRAAAELGDSAILFPGFVPPEELPCLLAATDVYVHPSEREPHSVAITEATYMGCPVVLSDRCGSYGPTDDVVPGRNGLVYPCGDVAALAAAIERLAADPVLRREFGDWGHENAARRQRMVHFDLFRASLRAWGLL